MGDEAKKYAVREVELLVVDIDLPYNAIHGRNSINAFEMVVWMIHLKAKFLTPEGAGECKGNQKTARELYLKALKGK